jgi:hypothetical protein
MLGARIEAGTPDTKSRLNTPFLRKQGKLGRLGEKNHKIERGVIKADLVCAVITRSFNSGLVCWLSEKSAKAKSRESVSAYSLFLQDLRQSSIQALPIA